jgi:DNA-binding transcriptional LysR family regulator
VGLCAPPVQDARLQALAYRSGRLAAIVPKKHALASRKRVRFAELLDDDFVGLHVGASVHELMHGQAQALGRTLKARLQVRGFDAIAQLVGAGLGVALLPAAVAERFAQLFSIRVLALDESWALRDYQLVVRAQPVLPSVVQRFVTALCPSPAPDARQSELKAIQP